jgi:hypothetical protein
MVQASTYLSYLLPLLNSVGPGYDDHARAEDKAMLESNLSADTSGMTKGQDFGSALFHSCPF